MNLRLLPLCFLLTAVLLLPKTIFAQEHRSPETFVKNWAKSILQNDAAALMKFYEQSEQLDVRVSGGQRFVGFKTLQESYRLDLEQIAFSRSSAKILQSRELGNVAVVSFEHKLRFKVNETGEQNAVHVQTVMVLKKVDKDWLIINEHSSPIRGIPRMQSVGDNEPSSQTDKN